MDNFWFFFLHVLKVDYEWIMDDTWKGIAMASLRVLNTNMLIKSNQKDGQS